VYGKKRTALLPEMKFTFFKTPSDRPAFLEGNCSIWAPNARLGKEDHTRDKGEVQKTENETPLSVAGAIPSLSRERKNATPCAKSG